MATYKGRHCIAGTGAPGTPGEKGEKGEAATIAISSTITLDPGMPAKVENEGDIHNAKFKFSIPKGEKGAGVSSIVAYYLASPNSQGITVSSNGWTDSAQLINSINKYLWCYLKFIFTNNTTSFTDPVIIGVYNKGVDNYDDLTNKPITDGTVTYQSNVSSRQIRNICFSTEEPTANDGANGDIWMVYSNE